MQGPWSQPSSRLSRAGQWCSRLVCSPPGPGNSDERKQRQRQNCLWQKSRYSWWGEWGSEKMEDQPSSQARLDHLSPEAPILALTGAGSRNAYGVDLSMCAPQGCHSIRSYLHSAAGSTGRPAGPWTSLGPHTVLSYLTVSCISRMNIPLCHQHTGQRACLGTVTLWRPTEQKS